MDTRQALARVRGTVFDMDNTLTLSLLDFDVIRAESGVPGGEPLLEFMDAAPTSHRECVRDVLARHEERAARECLLREGARHVVDELRRRGYRVALVTRNSAESVRTIVGRFGLELDAWLSRDDDRPKPAPDPVLNMACVLGLEPTELLVVGDHAFDMKSGRAAGALTAFLQTDKAPVPDEADFVIRGLPELLQLLPNSSTEATS